MAKLVTRLFRFSSRISLNFRISTTYSLTYLHTHYHHRDFTSKFSCVPARNYVQRSQVKAMSAQSPNDPSSYSRPEHAVMKHASLKLDVDFEKKVLVGSALLSFDVLKDVPELILDISGLKIHSVVTEDGQPLEHKIDGHIPNFGSRLTIVIPENLLRNKKRKDAGTDTITIEPTTGCLGCEKQVPTLKIQYDNFIFKPLVFDEPTSSDTDKEWKDKRSSIYSRNSYDDSEDKISKRKDKNVYQNNECCPSTYVIENIHDPCDIGKCTCGVQTHTISIVNIGCKGGAECTMRIQKEEKRRLSAQNKEAQKKIALQNELSNKNAHDDGTVKTDSGIDIPRTSISSDTNKVNTSKKNSINRVQPNNNDIRANLSGAIEKDAEMKPRNSNANNAGQSSDKKPIDEFKLRINYETTPEASALQWLDPQQTSGKKHPYMFSQCQPIHARSIIPCQDTPAVKFTYEAEVTAPEEFTILMSALRGDANKTGTSFKQPVPIPSYLLAIAVGVLEHKELGPRSLVWTEKEDLERSAWEFAETEKYLQAAEKLCGPYVWTQYDLLVLPPSFPYGGMENPCLTFVTPTLLAGDRSQADVIVHEIMHSWTGNLVTNKNFEHFWLNEGFTVFLERKVGASLIADKDEAKKSRDFHSLLGLQELSESVNQQYNASDPLTRLSPDLNGVHPDDAFSRVPYEKGSLFLRYLEDLVGGPEIFDDFLRAYLNRFKRISLDTNEFKAFLLDYFKDNEQLKTVDWEAWLYKPGMPPVIPDYDTSMTKAVTALLAKIESTDPLNSSDIKSLTPHQMINLLQELIDREPLSLDRLTELGREYKIAESHNSEIRYRWLRLNVRSHNEEKLPEIFEFVNTQGRMKFVRPIYRDLYAWQKVRDRSIDNFLKNEKNMMHVSAYTVRKDLHLDVVKENV